MSNPIKNWFILEPNTGGKKNSRFAAPNAAAGNQHLCGWPPDDADNLPPEKARFCLAIVSFNGQEVVVRASSGGKTGTARMTLGAALPAYVTWCATTAKVVLNPADPAASLPILEATEAAGDDAVLLGEDDRPEEAKVHDTKPMKPVVAGEPKKPA